MPFSSLRVARIEVPVRLGWLAGEREVPQPVRIELDLRFPAPPEACSTDRLGGTADYAALVERIAGLATSTEFHLIEKLARVLYDDLKPVLPTRTELALTVTKQPPLDAVKGGASFRLGDWEAEPRAE